MQRRTTKSIVFTALFAALTAACAFISIPVPGTPIPIVLQNLMVVLSGMLLGPLLGTVSTVVFILAGLLGIPVFSGGTGGFAKLMSPTGGFIIGYAISSLVSGLILGKPKLDGKKHVVRTILTALFGFAVMYIPGVLHFMNSMEKTLSETMILCVIPYLPGDLIKMVLCILISFPLRRSAAIYIFEDET